MGRPEVKACANMVMVKNLQSKTWSLENYLKAVLICEPYTTCTVPANNSLLSCVWSTSETDELGFSGNPVWFLLGHCLLSAEAAPCCLCSLAWCVLVSFAGKEWCGIQGWKYQPEMLDLSTAGSPASLQWWMLVGEFIFTEWTLTSNAQRPNRGKGTEDQAIERRHLIYYGFSPPGFFLFQRTWTQMGESDPRPWITSHAIQKDFYGTRRQTAQGLGWCKD